MSVASALPFLLLFTSFALPAQDEARTATPTPAQAPQRPTAVVVSTSFRGGTLAEFVAALRAVEPKANVVLATAAASARVPAMELRSAGLEQALESACAVAEADFHVRVLEFRGSGEPVYSVIAQMPSGVTAGTATTSQAAPAPRPEETTQVFSLNRLTDSDSRPGAGEGFKVETILSAIEAGTGDDAKKSVLRYHRESGLLFLRGTRAQTSMVKDLLSNLERDLDERRRRAAGPTRTPAPQEPAKKDEEKKD